MPAHHALHDRQLIQRHVAMALKPLAERRCPGLEHRLRPRPECHTHKAGRRRLPCCRCCCCCAAATAAEFGTVAAACFCCSCCCCRGEGCGAAISLHHFHSRERRCLQQTGGKEAAPVQACSTGLLCRHYATAATPQQPVMTSRHAACNTNNLQSPLAAQRDSHSQRAPGALVRPRPCPCCLGSF